MMNHTTHTFRTLLVALTLSVLALPAARALAVAETDKPDPVAGYTPEELQGVELVRKHDAQLPLDVQLVDSTGETVTTGELLDGDRPVIVNFVYYNCPMLCGLVSGAMVNGLMDLKWTAGDEFVILTISIDPREGPELAARNKRTWLDAYGREGAGEGWYFLTGTEENVRELADAVGFEYKWVPDRNEFNHPAGLIVLTPEGHVSQYLTKYSGSPPKFDPATLRLTLSEAADGKIGSLKDRFVDQFVLTCTAFDPESGSYAASAMGIMQLSGGVVALILAGVITTLLIKEMRQRRTARAATASTETDE